jgi:hypothetical protein
MRVLAKNTLGWSAFSEWSSIEDSHTKIGVPEKPKSLRPVTGTWNSITLEGIVPFANGSPVTSFVVQRRWVQPFDRGDWEIPLVFQLNDLRKVKFVKFVDTVQQEEDLYRWACEVAAKQNDKRSYNPFAVKSKENKGVTPEQLLSNEVN